MAIFHAILGISSSLSDLPPSILEILEGVIPFLKAASIAFIVYVFYAVIMAFINIRRARRVKRIEAKIDIINEKLEILVKKKSRKKLRKRKKN